MTKFLDGPAAGQVLSIRRAPVLLRVVQNRISKKWDALDQPDDEAKSTEDVYLYICQGKPLMMHISMRPRSGSGWHAMAEYRILADQPAEAILRDNKRYGEWCTTNYERIAPEWYRETVANNTLE